VEACRIGKRGTVVIPARLRKQFGMEEGDFIIAEERPEGVLIRPASLTPVEMYTPERKAELLLGNATTRAEYKAAVAEVRAMGLDPKRIPHFKPQGAKGAMGNGHGIRLLSPGGAAVDSQGRQPLEPAALINQPQRGDRIC